MKSRALKILSWALIVLVISLLLFIVLGPILQDPWIDGIISHWRVNYFTAIACFTITAVWLNTFRIDWREFRETGDMFYLLRVVIYPVAAIVLGVLWVLNK